MRRLLLTSFVTSFFCVGLTTEAATLYLDPHQTEINRGDTISVAVRLDTDEGECVNAIDGVLTYSPNIEPVDTSRGNSILSVWVEDPVIDKNNRTITFAGGIPNGYCGRIDGDPRLSNIVLELLFRSPAMLIGSVSDSDVAEIKFTDQTRALLNDGFGTDAPLTTYNASLQLLKGVGSGITNEWSERIESDIIPPEEFSITLERSENAFSNEYYIVFNTTDKQSGIDHYEVLEEPLEEQRLFRWGAETAPWREVRSPYVLEDQSLNSTIRVKAIDKAGNEYLTSLVPDEAKRELSAQNKVMIALVGTVLVAFIVAIIVLLIVRRRKPAEEEILEVDEEEYDEN